MFRQVLVLASIAFASSALSFDACPLNLPRDDVFLKIKDGKCYQFFVHEKKTFADAQEYCQSYGGNLAMIKNAKVNDYINATLQNDYDVHFGSVWIGLESDHGGDFTWVDGMKMIYNNLPVYHDGPAFHDVCVAFVPYRATWQEFECVSSLGFYYSKKNAFVCEYPTTKVYPTPKPSLMHCPFGGNTTDDDTVAMLENKCYYFGLEKTLTFQGAEAFCEQYGGTLALLKSERINRFVQNHLNETHKQQEFLWIGLRYNPFEYRYSWADGSEIAYSNFKHIKGKGDCVAMNSTDGSWYHRYCASSLIFGKYFICEFDMSGPHDHTTPKPVFGSTDQPTLSSSRPPLNPGDCLITGSKEGDIQTFQDKCYNFVADKYSTFEKAEKFCKQSGGMLAMVKSKYINDFLRSHLHSKYQQHELDKRFWIGLELNTTTDDYLWVDGTVMGFSNFLYSIEVGECAAISATDGRWVGSYECSEHSTLGGDKNHFICEYDKKK